MGDFIGKSTKRYLTALGVAFVFLVSGCQTSPEKPPVSTYQTEDPELKTYLTLFNSLSNSLQGVSGKEYDAQEVAAYNDRFRKNLLKNIGMSSGNSSREEQLSRMEHMIENRSKWPAPHHLLSLPPEVDSSESYVQTHTETALGNTSGVEQEFTTLHLSYKFSSIQAMSDKAHSLVDKLKPIFNLKAGWIYAYPETILAQQQDNRKNIEAMQNQQEKQKLLAMTDTNIMNAKAGQAIFQHAWYGDVNGKPNFAQIDISPTTNQTNEQGLYTLHVAFTYITYHYKKP